MNAIIYNEKFVEAFIRNVVSVYKRGTILEIVDVDGNDYFYDVDVYRVLIEGGNK